MSEPKRLKLDLENKISIEEPIQNQNSEIEKPEQESEVEKVNENYIADKEVERSLKIFDILVGEDKVQQLKESKALDSKDSTIDTIIIVARKIAQLLEGDIDSLNLPEIVSKSLKTLKKVVTLIKNAKDNASTNKQKSK